MKLGLFMFASLVLIATVSAFTYTMNPDYYAMEIMGINLNFPVAFWITLPMFLLLIFTMMHIFFYGLKHFFLLKKWKKDTNTLEDALYWSLVNEPKEQKYAIDELGSSARLLAKSSITISDNVDGLSPRLSRVVNIIRKIKNGEYIDLKEEKMSKVFHSGNPILIQNRLNCMRSDDKFVENVMKSTTEYSPEVQALALERFANKMNFIDARKYVKVFDVQNFLVMLKRIDEDDTLELTSEILTNFVKELNLTCRDFIEVALITKKYLRPEENLTLFRSYQSENHKAQNAYLYLLFEYELIEQVGIYLDEQEANDFLKFRAFYELKKQNSKYRLEDIIDIYSVCTKTKHY
ncbi:MAG: hypothetical protein U9O64_09015 [Campylobacterota bacterium]|nr:hypothetical protein [Campylobacterota bacterium]